MKKQKRSPWFTVTMTFVLLMVLGLIYRGYQLWLTGDYLFRELMNGEVNDEIPTWYPIATAVLGILTLIGVVLTYFYFKIGVYLAALSLIITIIIQPEFMPDGSLFTIMTLFIFTGYGFVSIIPRWKEFK